jgi:hypothetical protein
MRRETRRYRERRVNDAPLTTLIDAFATYNRAQGHSRRIVPWYTEGLRVFARWLRDEGYTGEQRLESRTRRRRGLLEAKVAI